MKRAREEEGEDSTDQKKMEIVWQTPANPPEKHDYIFRDGRRHVRPYYFEFISHVKNRWAGKTIVDLFAEEFKGRPYDYYVSAVKCGRIQVDGEMVPVSYIVKSSQKISHFLHRCGWLIVDVVVLGCLNVYTQLGFWLYWSTLCSCMSKCGVFVLWLMLKGCRHEPPVMALDVCVLRKEPDVVTVCKPASVPVHPCGQYRKNTVVGILQAEYAVHRLDRLVSGLLILARNASKADLFRQEIEGGLVQKQYVARVVGIFPEDEVTVEANINYNAREGRSTVEVGDSCGETIIKGKAACTKFSRISTNGTHSIVLCKPITGRTHQIRAHLQHTGHPIANDNLYLSEHVTSRSTEGVRADRAAARSTFHPISDISYSDTHKDNPKEDFDIDPMCTNCPNLAPKGYDELEEGLWLHCVRYSGPEWVYECPYPDWTSLA
ncbi:hypothetical protein Tsubulata_000612 [Turnera subulata]|uniref:RNA pseudouridine synthase 7 n=1 Tax=Turnera subulata TaxID=218843 RepID=A0A9Q0GHU0_9ROSI|nr:hypothetical protein Tsubulata_000612 [Turnera subulata]